jgi:hypothetical protein
MEQKERAATRSYRRGGSNDYARELQNVSGRDNAGVARVIIKQAARNFFELLVTDWSHVFVHNISLFKGLRFG